VTLRPSVSSIVGLQRRVVADPVDRSDGLGQPQLVEPDALLDHVEDQCGGADLEQRRVLRQVRVADDHVQAAVLVGVGVRLVAGVDDPALERGLQADLDLDVVAALRELVARLVTGGAPPDPAGADDHLPGDEERREPRHDRRERGLAGHEVVLVGAVAGALAVHVVLVQLHARGAGDGGGAHRGLLHHPLPRLVPDDDVARGEDLGRGELGVGVVDVEPGAVGEDDVGGARGRRARTRWARPWWARTGRTRARRAAATPPRSPSGPGASAGCPRPPRRPARPGSR
jgi:hypothetical protein